MMMNNCQNSKTLPRTFRLHEASNNLEIDKRIITDKEFYKAMQKLKDRGTNAVPPKKSASAYIIFGKEVSTFNFIEISI